MPFPAGHHPRELLPSRATLVLVPSHLIDQWAGEVSKFFGESMKCLRVDRATDLRRCTVRELQLVDVVLASHQLFGCEDYQQHLCPEILKWNAGFELHDDRRYLDSLEALWGNLSARCGTAAPVLEMFCWHRIIVDEVHELMPPEEISEGAERSQVWALPFTKLVARSRWGMTGTPPVQSVADVDNLSAFLQVHLGQAGPDHAQRFVDTFVRSSAIEHSALSEALHHTINVSLTHFEMVLHRDARHRLRASADKGDVTAWSQLLSSCSHHALAVQERERESCAKNQIEALRQRRKRHIAELTKKVDEQAKTHDFWAASAKNLQSELRHGSFPSLQLEQDARRRLQLAVGRAEELKDTLDVQRSELSVQRRQLDFLEQTLAQVQGCATAVECPVCTNEFVVASGELVITPCAHVYCKACFQRVAKEHGSCPTCRGAVAPGDCTMLTAEAADGPAGAEQRGAAAYGEFGSKIAQVVFRLLQIRAQDPSAKCLVYCQFDELSAKVLRALQHYRVPALSLHGSAAEMGSQLRKFTTAGGAQWVLLCSLQKKAAGMNLQCASHVLFVHPFYGRTADYTEAWEAQAIGRVYRQGQRKQVHVHRFVSLGTVEQELVAQRDPLRCMQYLPSGTPLQLLSD